MNNDVRPDGASVSYPSVALVLGSCISLQFGAALAVQLFDHASPWSVTFLRLAFAAVALCLVLRPQVHSWTRQQWIATALLGSALSLMNGFFYASIARIPLGVAVTIEFLGPLFLAAALSQSRRDILWVVMALAGMALFGADSFRSAQSQNSEPLDALGVVLVLIAAAFWTVYILMSKRVGQLVPGTQGLAVAMVFGTLTLAPMGVADSPTLFTDPQLLLLTVGTALLGSLIPYSLEMMALKNLGSGTFGILLSLEPVMAAFFGWLLLRQDLGPLPWLAIVLVVVSSIGVTLSGRRRPAYTSSSSSG